MTGCGRRAAWVGAPPRIGGGVTPSANVGASKGDISDTGNNVGASDPDSGTRVGASDGGGKSEEGMPGALDGARTTVPPSACVGESLSRWNRPDSPMSSCGKGKQNFSQRGNMGRLTPPAQPPAREIEVYTAITAVSAQWHSTRYSSGPPGIRPRSLERPLLSLRARS